MNQEKIGKFIGELRKKNNLTQEQLSEKLGVTNKSISRWENGRSMPDLSMFPLLSKELGVTVNDLMSGEIVKEELYQEKLEENFVNSVVKVKKKYKYNLFLVLIIPLLILVVIYILLNSINIKLKFDEDKMFIENHTQYGLRFVNKNNCTIYSGNVNHIVKEIQLDNEIINIIFVTASCSIHDLYKYHQEANGTSYRFLNFKILDEDVNKYKVYYTRENLNKLDTADNEYLVDLIDDMTKVRAVSYK